MSSCAWPPSASLNAVCVASLMPSARWPTSRRQKPKCPQRVRECETFFINLHGGQATMDTHRFSFLVETYATERQKILGVWAMFRDEEMRWKPHPQGRSVHEQMVHQCVSEDYWMKKFLGIEPAESPLPATETRLESRLCWNPKRMAVLAGPCPARATSQRRTGRENPSQMVGDVEFGLRW